MNNKRYLFHSYHLGNSKGFRKSAPGTRIKTKYIFLFINNNITMVSPPLLTSKCLFLTSEIASTQESRKAVFKLKKKSSL